MERRLTTTEFEVRQAQDGKRTIVGYAALFNELSVPLPSMRGVFQERLAPGAFRHVIGTDVRALWNHDPAYVLGRTTNGTLRLAEDDKGLRFEVDPPDTMLAQAFLANIERGDVSQMSFGFSVSKDGQTWDRNVTPNVRTVTAVSELMDVSPATFPAYPSTEVALRAFVGDVPEDGGDEADAVDGAATESRTDDESNEQALVESAEREAGLRAQAEDRNRIKQLVTAWED